MNPDGAVAIVTGGATRVGRVIALALAAEGALEHFREFGLGFNEALVAPEGAEWLPYYGYGAGVVRMSLGNNLEVGGAVGGAGVRWLFFRDATVTVGDVVVVDRGQLARR